MQFEGHILIRAPLANVWEFFTQIDRIARCIPGCQSVEALDADRYRVVIAEKLGIFRVTFTTEAKIEEVNPRVSIKAGVTGDDRKLGSRFRQTLQAVFTETNSSETSVDLRTEVQFMGKIAGLGYGILKRKADEALVKFGEAVRLELEGRPTQPPVGAGPIS
jgi:carbon monoxide dehydrogenase subunit G